MVSMSNATLKPAHLKALEILASGETLPALRGARGLWLMGLAEYVDSTNLRITEAGKRALEADRG